MTRTHTDTCASCDKFPIHEAERNAGRAICSIFEREHHYSDRACGPLYERDISNLSTRRRIVLALSNNEGESK